MVYPPESLARITPARLECAVFVLHERPTFLHRRACLTRRSWACALPRRSRACAAFTLALRSRATRLAFCSLPARSRALLESRSALMRRFLALSARSLRLAFFSLVLSSAAFFLAARSRFLAAAMRRAFLPLRSLIRRARCRRARWARIRRRCALRRRSAASLLRRPL